MDSEDKVTCFVVAAIFTLFALAMVLEYIG